MVAKCNETVWVSDAQMASGMSIKGLQFLSPKQREIENKSDDHSVQKIYAAMERYRNYEPMNNDEFPSKVYCQFSDIRLYAKKFPDFFTLGLVAVSRKFVDVASQFELGGTTFVPFEVYQHDGIERVECDYYFLNFGCYKKCFLPEHSQEDKFSHVLNPNVKDRWLIGLALKDYQIAVSSGASEGCDLWVDPRLGDVFFLSERLEKALKAAKLTRKIRRHKCAVIDDENAGQDL